MPEEQTNDQNQKINDIITPSNNQGQTPGSDGAPQTNLPNQSLNAQASTFSSSEYDPVNQNIPVIQPLTLDSLPPSNGPKNDIQPPTSSDQTISNDSGPVSASSASSPIMNSEALSDNTSSTGTAIATAPVIASGNASSKPRKISKKLLVSIIALIAVFVLGGSAYAAYVWYENPQKVLTDSILNTLTAKTSIYSATLTIEESSAGKATVDITSKVSADSIVSLEARLTYSVQDETFSIKGAVQNDSDGNLYVKFEQLTDLVTKVKSTLATEISSYPKTTLAVESFVEKINGKWIKISASDLATYSSDASEAQTCTNDVIDKFQGDITQIKEVTDLYQDNQFIIIDKQVGLKDGKYDFMIKNDKEKTRSFIKGLQDTKIYKALHDCDGSLTLSSSDVLPDTELDNNGTVEIWIDMWSHQISKIDVESKTGGTKTSLIINPQFNQDFKISTPTDSVTLKQLEEYINEVTDAFSEDMNDYYSDYDFNYDLTQ